MAAGKPDQVPDGEKVGFVTQFLDQRQFVFDQAADFVRDAAGVTLRAPFQVRCCRYSNGVCPGGASSSGYSYRNSSSENCAARGDFQVRCSAAGTRETSAQFLQRVQMALRIRLQALPGLRHRHPMTERQSARHARADDRACDRARCRTPPAECDCFATVQSTRPTAADRPDLDAERGQQIAAIGKQVPKLLQHVARGGASGRSSGAQVWSSHCDQARSTRRDDAERRSGSGSRCAVVTSPANSPWAC